MKLIITIIISLTIMFCVRWLTRTPITIHHEGIPSNGNIAIPQPVTNNTTPQLTTLHTITVQGNGEVDGTPDTMLIPITISLRDKVPTGQEAMNIVNESMDTVFKLLKKFGIEEKNIKTTSLNLQQQYDYRNNQRYPMGYSASQMINTKFAIDNGDTTKAEKLIDELTRIKNIQLHGFSFDIEDKDEILTQSRALAYDKAKHKAQELANLAGKRLGDAISINEGYTTTPQIYQEMRINDSDKMVMGAVMPKPAPTTSIQPGELKVSTQLTITFKIED